MVRRIFSGQVTVEGSAAHAGHLSGRATQHTALRTSTHRCARRSDVHANANADDDVNIRLVYKSAIVAFIVSDPAELHVMNNDGT